METIGLHYLGAGLVAENKRLLSEQKFNCELISQTEAKWTETMTRVRVKGQQLESI